MPIQRSLCEYCTRLSEDQQLWNDFCEDCLLSVRQQLVIGRWQLLENKSARALDFWIQNFRLFQFQLCTSKICWKGGFCSMRIKVKGLLVSLQDSKVVFSAESMEGREDEDWSSYQLIFWKVFKRLKERWPIIWL